MLNIATDGQQLIARYQARIARMNDLTQPITRALSLAVSASKRRFTANNWRPNAPSTIKRKGSSQPGIDRGHLRQSIIADQIESNSGRYGTNLFYARYFQEGTGTYAGHSKWHVKSRSRLNATLGASGIRREGKERDGQPPRPFMYFDDPLKAKIQNAFRQWIRMQALPLGDDD